MYEIVVALNNSRDLPQVVHGIPCEPTTMHSGYGVLTYEGLDDEQIYGLGKALDGLGIGYQWCSRRSPTASPPWPH